MNCPAPLAQVITKSGVILRTGDSGVTKLLRAESLTVI
jgi:hypothetical protein